MQNVDYAKVFSWVDSNMSLSQPAQKVCKIDPNTGCLEVKAINAKEGTSLKLTLENDMDENTCQVFIYSESIKVASAIIQSLFSTHLGIQEAMAKACFPKDFSTLE